MRKVKLIRTRRDVFAEEKKKKVKQKEDAVICDDVGARHPVSAVRTATASWTSMPTAELPPLPLTFGYRSQECMHDQLVNEQTDLERTGNRNPSSCYGTYEHPPSSQRIQRPGSDQGNEDRAPFAANEDGEAAVAQAAGFTKTIRPTSWSGINDLVGRRKGSEGLDSVDMAVTRPVDVARCKDGNGSGRGMACTSQMGQSWAELTSDADGFTMTSIHGTDEHELSSCGDGVVGMAALRPDRDESTTDDTDFPPPHMPFNWVDTGANVFAIGSYLLDIGTDIWVALLYYRHRHWWWFGMTLTFVVVPAITMTVFSLRWYIEDHRHDDTMKGKRVSKLRWASRFMFLILQIAPILRYIDTLIYGWKSKKVWDDGKRKHWYNMMLYEDADSAMLRLFECFLEAAPQLVLQLYIMDQLGLRGHPLIVVGQCVSCITSLVSLAWAVGAYNKALRFSLSDKANMTYKGLAVYFMWRIFTIAARILSLAMFASFFKWWIFVLVGVHWAVMFIWIRFQTTKFCQSRKEEVLFNIVAAMVYIFCFFNLIEGHTRLRYLIYYVVIYVENLVMIVCWYSFTQTRSLWYHWPTVAVVLGGFFLGITFQIIYYLCCHPNNFPPCPEYMKIRCWVPVGELCGNARQAIEISNTLSDSQKHGQHSQYVCPNHHEACTVPKSIVLANHRAIVEGIPEDRESVQTEEAASPEKQHLIRSQGCSSSEKDDIEVGQIHSSQAYQKFKSMEALESVSVNTSFTSVDTSDTNPYYKRFRQVETAV